MSTAKSIICFFFEHNPPKPKLERQRRSLGLGRGWDRGAGRDVAATCHPSEPGHDMRNILLLEFQDGGGSFFRRHKETLDRSCANLPKQNQCSHFSER